MMFRKNPNLQYHDVVPARIVSAKLVRAPAAFVKNEGAATFLCGLGEANLLMDFAEEIVGGLEMRLYCAADAHVTVVYDETPDETMRCEPFVCSWYENLIDEYDLEPGEHRLLSLGRRGFRYAAVFVRSEKSVELFSAVAHSGGWPVKMRGFFRCSDERLNRIWDISAATVRACMQDFYEDGVKRDGLLWQGDYRLTFLSEYAAFGDGDLARKCLLMIRDSQYECGAIPACCARGGGHQHDRDDGILYMPTIPEGLNNWVIPNYMCEYILSIEQYVRHTGDLDVLPEVMESAEKTMRCLMIMADFEEPGTWWVDEHATVPDENGLIYCIEYDCTMNPKTSVVSKGVFLLDMLSAAKALARLAERTGDTVLKAYADEAAAKLDIHIEAHYREPHFGQIIDHVGQTVGDILQYAATHAVFAGKEDKVGMERLIRAMMPNWGYALTLRVAALFESGHIREALRDVRETWGKMLDNESLTCWERLDIRDMNRTHYYDAPGSYCHGWTAGPAYLLPQWIAGVQCEADGYEEICIEPHLCDLDWVETSAPTPHGEIVVRAERDGLCGMKLWLDIPEGVKACTVKWPDGKTAVLSGAGQYMLGSADW